MSDPAIFDVVLEALVRQHQHPSENGGGMIGMAGAVVKALGLDGDQPRSFLHPPHYPDPDREDPSWRLTRLQACPRCGAPAGAMCRTRSGNPTSMPHSVRSRRRIGDPG